MKLLLSANISKLRKEHSMTQEQLAEALGVTFASVSKWERGVATPELNLIAEMADMFEVSIDALIGYEFRNNNRESVIARLKQYAHNRDNEDVFSDVEKALQCYPNCLLQCQDLPFKRTDTKECSLLQEGAFPLRPCMYAGRAKQRSGDKRCFYSQGNG